MSKSTSFITAVILVCVLAYVDVATGYEIGLSLFYLIPVALATWRIGLAAGLSLSVASVIGMFTVDNFVTRDIPFPSHDLIPYWNTGIRLGYFVVFVLILAALKGAHDRETRCARADSLTGVANCRAFADLAHTEILRAERYCHPLSLAYVDCDDFKRVNDEFGHGRGDQVLKLVATTLKERLRKFDIIARVGGDEFVILLPETTAVAAREVIQSLRTLLAERMRTHGWGVTVSVGVCTFVTPPATLELALKLSDDLMYSAKQSGKDTVRHRVFDGPNRVTDAEAA